MLCIPKSFLRCKEFDFGQRVIFKFCITSRFLYSLIVSYALLRLEVQIYLFDSFNENRHGKSDTIEKLLLMEFANLVMAWNWPLVF